VRHPEAANIGNVIRESVLEMLEMMREKKESFVPVELGRHMWRCKGVGG